MQYSFQPALVGVQRGKSYLITQEIWVKQEIWIHRRQRRFGSNNMIYLQDFLHCSRFFYLQDIEILGWCPVGLVLPHGEKVPL